MSVNNSPPTGPFGAFGGQNLGPISPFGGGLSGMKISDAVRDATTHQGSDMAQTLAHHRKHIQAIWRHLERLEQFISPNVHGELVLSVGMSSITLKKNGDVTIKGGNISIDGHGKVTVKASSDLVMKGSKIQQN